jgi:hypothetical protein
MNLNPICVLLLLGAACQAEAQLPRSAAAPGARVYFIAPADGASVARSFAVRFGLSGMGVAPAGVALEHTGHHHLLVDVDPLPAEGMPLPNDGRHLHFGKGQTETQLTLEPGTHTLQLILGDHLHIPHQPPVVSEKITITVE